MWKIKRIKAENIVSFKKLDLTVRQGKATLIFGQNNDSDGQNANGSGKSAIMEAISIALTGDSLRKVQTDEIISDWADQACVSMELYNDYSNRTFIIERNLHRKESQKISCRMFDEDGAEIMKDYTTQPTVPLYDKFILSVLGIERDELFNSYILCKNKYKSFLDASDKDKKELINRFTNGRMVDESIEALETDIETAKELVNEKELRMSKLNGSIEAVNEQIKENENSLEEEKNRIAEKIAEHNRNIESSRAEIRELNSKIQASDKRLDAIDKIGDDLEALEKSDTGVSECYTTIRKWYSIYKLGDLADYGKCMEDITGELDDVLKNKIILKDKLDRAEAAVAKIQKGYEHTREEYSKAMEKSKADGKQDREQLESILETFDNIDNEIADINVKISKAKRNAEECGKELAELSNILHGAIECPKCKHKFIVSSDKTIDQVNDDYKRIEELRNDLLDKVDDYKGEIEKKESEKQELSGTKAEIEKRNSNRAWSLSSYQQLLDMARKNLSDAKMKVSTIKSDDMINQGTIDKLKEQIQTLRETLFNDVFSNMDRIMDAGENYVSQMKERVSFLEGAINSYQEMIESLNKKPEDVTKHLKESLKKYKKELKEASANYDEALVEYNKLAVQKEHFLAFKSHLANTKIDAIAQMTNLFLQEIGSDIRIELEGFKLLKSGKMREKITVKILRDGEEVGSINKMSAGERTRVYLANILAMQKLSNGGCKDGEGLDFLALDEILEAVDYEGLMNSCEALNSLAVTSLVITQNSVQESYPNTIIVSKTNGISIIQ